MPRKIDPIKSHVATEVAKMVNYLDRTLVPGTQEELRVTQNTGLLSEIRVSTLGGPRYFQVIVKERY